MKHLFAAAACSIVLASAGGAWAAGAPAAFEAAVIASTTQNPVGFFRVEVATGKVWQAWGAAPQFTPVVDSAPLPAGEYHIYTGTFTTPDGKIAWSVSRMDAATGRSWVATGGGAAPLVWNEILTPK